MDSVPEQDSIAPRLPHRQAELPASPRPVQSDEASLRELLEQGLLEAVFQPIVSLRTAEIVGYEGLIRGPRHHSLALPVALFARAREDSLTDELERACRRTITSRFAELKLVGRLFLNLLPSTITEGKTSMVEILAFLQQVGMRPEQIVLEITENQPQGNLADLRNSLAALRNMGFTVAIDDLGEGFASLKLWSELRPEYVKIDKHFVQDLHRDSFKLQFVRAIHEISSFSGASVIAEGIETAEELRVTRDLGIEFGQGFLLGMPAHAPIRECSAAVRETIGADEIAVMATLHATFNQTVTVGRLVTMVEPLSPLATNDQVMARFERESGTAAIPVVVEGVPIGIVRRTRLIQEFARQFRHELFDKRTCTLFMDTDPLIVEATRSLHEVGGLLTEMDRRHLASGFVITEHGRYLGMGNGQALVRELTQLQITAARYSNPLTQLPGNVPIYEHVDRLLAASAEFVACYCDIDDFKPYNDVYGYRKGDEMIRLLARLLVDNCDPRLDFVGHIGGDDFTLHLQSRDWEVRCRNALAQFDEGCLALVTPTDAARRGYFSENRLGGESFYALPTLSIGAIAIDAHAFASHAEVSLAMAGVKKEAKRMPGSSLFVERRRPRAPD